MPVMQAIPVREAWHEPASNVQRTGCSGEKSARIRRPSTARNRKRHKIPTIQVISPWPATDVEPQRRTHPLCPPGQLQ
jgi:hypothetical protein